MPGFNRFPTVALGFATGISVVKTRGPVECNREDVYRILHHVYVERIYFFLIILSRDNSLFLSKIIAKFSRKSMD